MGYKGWSELTIEQIIESKKKSGESLDFQELVKLMEYQGQYSMLIYAPFVPLDLDLD